MEVFTGNWATEMSEATLLFHDTENPNFFSMDLHSSPENSSPEVTVGHPMLFSPEKQLRPDNGHISHKFSSSHIISFGQATPATPRVGFRSVQRPGQNPQDHVISERKRREKLSRRFVSLSAIVPGLKKTDKASVLEEATKYVKELQGRVKLLEERMKTKVVESIVLVKSTDNNNNNNTSLPEIEAKVSEDNLLIKIHCQNNKGLMSNILTEIETLHLTIITSTVLPFGGYSSHITVIAKMGYEFMSTVGQVLNRLKLVLSHKEVPPSF